LTSSEQIHFSVIIPTYNRKEVLKRAIDSVLAQTFSGFEVIVVDDGSQDDTGDLLKESYPNVQYFKIENQGVSAARNFGVSKARGKFLAFLDSDDEWLPKKLEKQFEYISEKPETKLIHSNEIWIRNGKRVNQMKKHVKQGGDFFHRALELCLISPSAVVIEKQFFEKHEGFDVSFEVCEDYDLWLRMKSDPAIGEIAYHEEPLIKKYGGHEDQLSRKYFAMDFWRVRSMYRLLQTVELSGDRKKALLDVLIKKCEILIAGYQKHNNLENVPMVKEILENSTRIYEEIKK
jgi:glycosyltransferase involved in cell wall biosynthesis